MKITTSVILLFIITSCNSVKLPLGDKTVIIKSNSTFREKLKRHCLVQSNTLYGCQVHVNFKDKELIVNDFSINALKKEAKIDLYIGSNATLLTTKTQENFIINIYSINPKDDVKSRYTENYKLISIQKVENDIVLLLLNDSNFEDNVSELFLLERFKELELDIKDKKMMKNLYRTL